MKVGFRDCTFGEYEPHIEIEYKGRSYRAVELTVVTEEGTTETHTIATTKLADALYTGRRGKDADRIDQRVSYYAEDDENLYELLGYILHDDYVEYVGTLPTGTPRRSFFAVFNEHRYPSGYKRKFVANCDTRQDAIRKCECEARAEIQHFRAATHTDADSPGTYYKDDNVVGWVITPDNGVDPWYFVSKVVEVEKFEPEEP